MENVLIDKHAMQDIGNAIRTKHQNTTKLKPADMAPAILSISGEKSSKVTVNKVDHIQTQVNVGFGTGTVVAHSGQAVEQSVKPNNLDLQILLKPDAGWKTDGYTLSKPSYVLGDDIVVTVRPALKLENKKVQFTVHRAVRINGGYALSPNTNLPEYMYIPVLNSSYNIQTVVRQVQSKYAVFIQNRKIIFTALLSKSERQNIDMDKPMKDCNLLGVNIECTERPIMTSSELYDFGEGENSYYLLYYTENISTTDEQYLFININGQYEFIPPTPNTKKMNENFDFYKGEISAITSVNDAPWNDIKALGETIGTVPLITSGVYDYTITFYDNSKSTQERANAFYILCYYYHNQDAIKVPYKSLEDINNFVSIILPPQ